MKIGFPFKKRLLELEERVRDLENGKQEFLSGVFAFKVSDKQETK